MSDPIPGERATGRKVRRRVPRSSHEQWTDKHRKKTALEILERSTRGRLPNLLELRYQRMAASSFCYFRGAVAVMAYDIGRQPHTGVLCQLCGDAHLHNLGAYAGYDGNLIFDINDFDETIRGPFEWDVKRLATSILLAGRESGARERESRDAATVFLKRYRKSMHVFAAMPILELARYQIHRKTDLAAVAQVFAKAERSTPLHNLDILTQSAITKGEKSRIFRSNPPILERLTSDEAGLVLASLQPYARQLQPERRHFLNGYKSRDVAFKVVGIGSVGLRCYCLYLEGNGLTDPLFLQIKEEVSSAWSPYQGIQPKLKAQQGRRAMEGQRAMQVQSDPFLGYTSIEGRDYLVRQLNDHKASIDFKTLSPAALCHYADLCGELLARGHARSGDPVKIAGYLGTNNRFDKAILHFALAYAEQTERDWKELVRTRKKGS
jgi:uncharacterized protein (DUF2252 family)